MRRATASGESHPFVKWAGGKSQLLAAYRELFPARPLGRYHEPFLGSGAVFFDLVRQGALDKGAILSDLNEHLVTTWTVVRDLPDALHARLRELAGKHSNEEYYLQRERFNEEEMDAPERAALFIYLNKTGFNGLFRVNSRGRFNVPVGRPASGGPSFPTLEALRACSRDSKGVLLLHAPFTSVLDRARKGDFVYFDPPYVPISRTSSFTAYDCAGFGMAEQELLRDVFVRLDERGCKVMLSNSASFDVLKLYQGYGVVRVPARRSINSRADARGPVNEVVIRNYE